MADRLVTIARELWLPIPQPPKPKPKPQASWAALKPKQRLELTQFWFDSRTKHEVGTVFEIVGVDSLGMDVVPVAHLTEHPNPATIPPSSKEPPSPSPSSRWEQRDWALTWKKVRRPR